MEVKSDIFLYNSNDTVTIPIEMYKTRILKKGNCLLSRKSNEVTLHEKECNELLVIRYLMLSVTVSLQLLVTAILNVTITLLVKTKSN
jgi:hypothetical protein